MQEEPVYMPAVTATNASENKAANVDAIPTTDASNKAKN